MTIKEIESIDTDGIIGIREESKEVSRKYFGGYFDGYDPYADFDNSNYTIFPSDGSNDDIDDFGDF